MLLCGGLSLARAQQPPLTIAAGGPPPAGPNAVPFESWLLYPQLDTFTNYSNNYFLSPQAKVSGWSFGETPSMTAEWSNGIHTTTLYGNFTHVDYPTDNAVNTNDGEATVTQQYAPLRDLNFTFLADYTHHTIASALTSGIPSPISSTATTVLPNGNTVLPNGTIVSPNGVVVGQAASAANVAGLSVVDPYDAYTVTGNVQKLFGDGVVTLGASVLRRDYDEQASQGQDFTAKTFTEDAAFWLGPVLYFYSDAAFTQNDETSPAPDIDAYRAIAGLGTRQFGLFRGSAYFGHQGSQSSGSQPAGGNVYGGSVSYYPTPIWTLSANLDVTINLAPSGSSPSTLALTTPSTNPLQVPLSSSSNITVTSVKSEYIIRPDWTANTLISYSHVEYLGAPTWEDVWAAIGSLRYDMRRDLSLTWQYQYSSIVSNLPLTNANRNFVSMTASYKF
jgi:Putative beta-barrel porin 2